MEISKLGEFGLIKRLTEDIVPENQSTEKGIGDDCAVLNYGGDKRILVTTDMLMEGIHFDLQYTPLKHLGWKSIMVNLSDVYAMNGTPRQATVSLALSKRFTVEDIEELYAGMRLACMEHHVDLVGGDTTSSLTGLAISITVIGEAKSDEIAYRSGAHPTDLVCVSGNLGAAYMGLQLLEREKAVFNSQVDKLTGKQVDKLTSEQVDELTGERVDELDGDESNNPSAIDDFQPDFSGREYLLERQLRPEARRDIIERLRQAGIRPTSMMDISDGLSSELMHICTQSNTGCRIYEERIPLDYQTAAMAEELNMNVTTCAMNGGEDYELLFTVPLTLNDKVSQIEDVHVIGYITEPALGRYLITRDGQEFELKAQGWNPL